MVKACKEEKFKVILYAPNINVGGGLVLLKNLLEIWPEEICTQTFLDKRAYTDLSALASSQKITWVKPKIISRLKAEISLASSAKVDDIIICLNSLPPLFKSRGKIIVFIQNRNLIEKISLSSFKFRQAMRILLERWICYFFRKKVSQFIVQTDSFKQTLEEWYPSCFHACKPNVKVLPFMDFLEVSKIQLQPEEEIFFDFIYVADGLAHKNHETLFEAWLELSKLGRFPSLLLTIPTTETELLLKVKKMQDEGINILNFGQMPHGEIIQKYRQSRALIYPSLRESFGLPLIEASLLNIPILAGELDYVYDVCDPVTTFNPNSPKSIARAVERFLGLETKARRPQPPEKFVEYILSLR